MALVNYCLQELLWIDCLFRRTARYVQSTVTTSRLETDRSHADSTHRNRLPCYKFPNGTSFLARERNFRVGEVLQAGAAFTLRQATIRSFRGGKDDVHQSDDVASAEIGVFHAILLGQIPPLRFSPKNLHAGGRSHLDTWPAKNHRPPGGRWRSLEPRAEACEFVVILAR